MCVITWHLPNIYAPAATVYVVWMGPCFREEKTPTQNTTRCVFYLTCGIIFVFFNGKQRNKTIITRNTLVLIFCFSACLCVGNFFHTKPLCVRPLSRGSIVVFYISISQPNEEWNRNRFTSIPYLGSTPGFSWQILRQNTVSTHLIECRWVQCRSSNTRSPTRRR